MRSQHRLGRRALLSAAGAGALLATDVGRWLGLLGRPAKAQEPGADNLLLISWPFGLDPRWLPRDAGAGYELARLGDNPNRFLSEPILEDLVARHRDRLLIVSGLRAGFESSAAADTVAPACLWTGWNGDGASNQGALSPLPSVDQVIAEQLQADRPWKSIHAGINGAERASSADAPPGTFYHWAATQQGIQPVADPGELSRQLGDFVQLARQRFAEERALAGFASREAERVASQIDEHRGNFGTHQAALRDYEETRIAAQAGCGVVPSDPAISGQNARLAINAARVTKANAELLAMAFRCDLTKVAALELAPPRGALLVPYDGATTTVHSAAHGGDAEAETRAVSSRYFMDRLADVLDVLAATDVGSGQSLLDRTLVVMSSEMGSPDSNPANVPVFIAGGSGGFFKRAEHVALSGEPTLNRLLVTLLRYFGLDTETFGNVVKGNFKGALPELMI
jgi:hypothetical protein